MGESCSNDGRREGNFIMEATHSSEDWSQAHIQVNDQLNHLLRGMRDYGYNPSLHISYDKEEHHLQVDPVVISKHSDLKRIYLEYLDACKARDAAVHRIQSLPKLDLGFSDQSEA
jgi:hypothetical protein